MTIVFVTQISSAIFAFQFIGQSKWIASRSIEELMNDYSYYYDNAWAMNWIQGHVRITKKNFFLKT